MAVVTPAQVAERLWVRQNAVVLEAVQHNVLEGGGAVLRAEDMKMQLRRVPEHNLKGPVFHASIRE